MNNSKKNFLSLILGVVLVVAVSVYIYKDLHQPVPKPVPQNENKEQGGVSIQTDQPGEPYKVELVEVSNKVAPIAPKMPNLALPVVNYSHIDKTAFDTVSKNISILTEEVKNEPKNESKWLNLGIFRKMLGDYEAAAEIFSYTAVIWPKDYVPFNNLADVYQSYIKNYPLAEKNWLKVIELKPDNPEAYENLYNLYMSLYKEKQDKALPILLKGFDNNPASTDLLVYIARHYRLLGDKKNASLYYEKAIDEARVEKNEQLESSLRAEAAQISQ